MREKLKAVLRSSRRSKSPSTNSPRQSYESVEASSPRAEHHSNPSGGRARAVSDAPNRNSLQSGRNRPVSAAHDDRRDHAQLNHSDSLNGSIANDYRSYLPVLNSAEDPGEQNMTFGGDRRPVTGERDRKHGVDVADRILPRYRASLDADRNKPLPVAPGPSSINQQPPRKQSIGAGPLHSTIRAVPPVASAGQYAGRDVAINRSLPHNEVSAHHDSNLKQGSLPLQAAHDESRNTRGAERDGNAIQSPPKDDMARRNMDGHRDVGGNQNWKAQQQELLKGVVDLRNTVDTDKHTQLAAPVTQEIIKPHEHEVIQHKIFREIHDYEYYNRLLPVLHTEVLPPRHFIPNPNGEGLLEISADELPSRTGENRWWAIVQKHPPRSSFEDPSYKFRTKPEIIEGPTTTTEEGFERKETTILYPQTLQDMSGYPGLVQPVHFDHKTGESWLGAPTTMDKLTDQHNQDSFKMRQLAASLPEVPPSPTVKRRPVGA